MTCCVTRNSRIVFTKSCVSYASLSACAAARLVPPIFPLEALLARPDLDQRTVYGEGFIAHQILCLGFHVGKELLCQFLIEQPIAILAEDGVIRFVDFQAHNQRNSRL